MNHTAKRIWSLAAIKALVLLCSGILQSAEDSLFYYKGRMNWTDFHDPDFIPTYNPVFTDTELETEARDLCSDDTACLFDVAATGRLEIGSSALSAKEEQDVVAALAVPSKFTCLQTCSKRKRVACRLASCMWWSNHAHFRRCMLVCMYMCTSVRTCERMLCMYECVVHGMRAMCMCSLLMCVC